GTVGSVCAGEDPGWPLPILSRLHPCPGSEVTLQAMGLALRRRLDLARALVAALTIEEERIEGARAAVDDQFVDSWASHSSLDKPCHLRRVPTAGRYTLAARRACGRNVWRNDVTRSR